MSTTITTGASTITPTTVLDYSSTRESRTIVHPILGSSSSDVTLRAAGPRTGTLNLGFHGTGSEAASKAAIDLLATAAVFNLTSTERSSINMLFVVQGNLTRTLDEESRDAWTVACDYYETA